MNMICRSLVSLAFELNEPNVRSTEVGLTSKNTMNILNKMKPVTMALTAMDAAKAVRVIVYPQGNKLIWSGSNAIAPSDASQVARDDKFKKNRLIK